jgi:hypothetical protein
LILALEAAIDHVETVSSRHDELRALQSLDRLIEGSGLLLPQHSMGIAHNPVLTIEQAPPATSDATRLSTFLPSAAQASEKRARNRHWSRKARLLAGCLVAVVGLTTYLILDRQFGLVGPGVTPPVEAATPASQRDDAVGPSPTIRPQSAGLPLPIVYGVYAISEGQLNELESLPIRAPDPRVFMSAVIKKPSRTFLPNGQPVFIAFRRDIATSAPDRVAVRVIAKVARAMTFNPTAPASVAPVDDEWAIRSTSYELRVAPVSENPEMLVFRPETPHFVFPSGRYGLVLKGQAFDFTVAGPVTETSHCLERTDAANGTFYSECRNP